MIKKQKQYPPIPDDISVMSLIIGNLNQSSLYINVSLKNQKTKNTHNVKARQ